MLTALWRDFEGCVSSVPPVLWFFLGAGLLGLLWVKAAQGKLFD